ncbi:MAG: hypothetical protein KDK78_03335 [Chlamydiia bacterium]|nr:hypothetical protein [Chlamydiia bacterium]
MGAPVGAGAPAYQTFLTQEEFSEWFVQPSAAPLTEESPTQETQRLRQRLCDLRNRHENIERMEAELKVLRQENAILRKERTELARDLKSLEGELEEWEQNHYEELKKQVPELCQSPEIGKFAEYFANASRALTDAHQDKLEEIYAILEVICAHQLICDGESTDDEGFVVMGEQTSPGIAKQVSDQNCVLIERLQALVRELNLPKPEALFSNRSEHDRELLELEWDFVVVHSDSLEDLHYPGWWDAFRQRVEVVESHFDTVSTTYNRVSKVFTAYKWGMALLSFTQGPVWGTLALAGCVATSFK